MVPVGKIVSAHGVQGAVKVFPYGDILETKEEGEDFYISVGKGYKRVTLQKIWRQRRCWILTFLEIADRNNAEELVGYEIYLPEESLPKPDEGEYYYYQLIGLRVVSRNVGYIGTITGIIETGANDVYVIKYGNKEILVPAIEGVIIDINLSVGEMTVDLPEGLIEE